MVQFYLVTVHSSVPSTSNGKKYLGLSVFNICSHSVLYTVSQKCDAFPVGLVSQMRLLASSVEITSYNRKVGTCWQIPETSRTKWSITESGADPKDSVQLS